MATFGQVTITESSGNNLDKIGLTLEKGGIHVFDPQAFVTTTNFQIQNPDQKEYKNLTISPDLNNGFDTIMTLGGGGNRLTIKGQLYAQGGVVVPTTTPSMPASWDSSGIIIDNLNVNKNVTVGYTGGGGGGNLTVNGETTFNYPEVTWGAGSMPGGQIRINNGGIQLGPNNIYGSAVSGESILSGKCQSWYSQANPATRTNNCMIDASAIRGCGGGSFIDQCTGYGK